MSQELAHITNSAGNTGDADGEPEPAQVSANESMASAVNDKQQINANEVQPVVEEFPVPEILKPLIDHANTCREIIAESREPTEGLIEYCTLLKNNVVPISEALDSLEVGIPRIRVEN